MLQESGNEDECGESAGLPVNRAGWLVSDRDLILGDTTDASIAQSDAMDVGSEVFE